MVGVSVGRATLYLYELVGECVYLYVGRGRDGWGKVGRTNDDRGKDVVPLGCEPVTFRSNNERTCGNSTDEILG